MNHCEVGGKQAVRSVTFGHRFCVGFVANGKVRVYHGARLGSIWWVTDESGNVAVGYVYEGFGKVVGQIGAGGGAYQFCGLWYYRNDGDAGLLHVGARYYEVETGRWVQKDPIFGALMHPQTFNRYVYVTNDPVNSLDPNGTWKWTVIGAVTGAVGGGLLGLIVGQPGYGALIGGMIGAYIGHKVDIYVETKKGYRKRTN